MANPHLIDYGIPFKWLRHEATEPDLDPDGYDAARPQVVVVGAGPTGLTIAAGLSRLGVKVLVLEADEAVCRSSRASGISQRTFETINRVAPGVGDELAAKGIPTLGSETFYGERLVLRQMGADVAQTRGKYPPNSYLSQWNIEDALVRTLESRPDAVELRWCSRVTDITTDSDDSDDSDEGTILTVEPDGGQPYKVRAPWVVATDGSHSTMRRLLGLRMEGLAYEVSFVVVDAEIGGVAPPPIRRVWFDPDYLPGGLLLRHMSPDGIWRLDFQLPIGADLQAALEPAHVEQMIRAHLAEIGHPSDVVRPIWISEYKARALCLPKLRHGRVLFAGDAAHVVPIFGGFGLNSGMDDADNLQWKLAMVVRGLAVESLLDTYDTERIAAVRSTLEFVTRAAEFMTPTSTASEQLRVAALSLAAQGNTLAAGLARHRPSRPMPYPESAICRPNDGAGFDAGPPPGESVARGWLGGDADARRYLLDLLGAPLTFLVLASDDVAAAAPAALARNAAKPYGDAVATVVAAGHSDLLSEYGVKRSAVYLVRADGVVVARWHDPGERELADALAAILPIHPAANDAEVTA